MEILHEIDHLFPIDLLPGHLCLPHFFQHLRPMIPHGLGHEDGGDLAFEGGEVPYFGPLGMAEVTLFLQEDGLPPFGIAGFVKVSC